MIVALAALGGTALIAAGPFDVATIVTRRASASLGRPVTVAAARLHVGATATVELSDLVIDNAPGGTTPEMLRVSHLQAEGGPWSLLLWYFTDRPFVVRRLSVEGVRLFLEHAPEDRPNWRFGEAAPSPSTHRANFPDLLDISMRDLEIDLRTSSGRILRVTVESGGITTSGADQPVRLSATGAYNAIPIQFSATTQSFTVLRQVTQPFGVELHFVSGDSAMDFAGTMTDPLNADGADGRLALNAPSWDRLLALAGADAKLAMPLILEGAATRQGDVWALTDAKGALRGHPFTATAGMKEGPRHAPDDITLNAGFSLLDLNGLHQGGSGETELRIDDNPGTLLAAHVTAEQLLYGAWQARNVDLTTKLSPGSLSIEPLRLRIADGAARIDATIENTKAGAAVRLDGTLDGAGVSQLSNLLDLGALPLGGAIDVRSHIRAKAKTLAEAVRSNRGIIVLSMRGGSIERKVIEGASTDVRLLFRAPEGNNRLSCLVTVMELRDGVGRIATRVRASDGTIAAGGTIRLRDETLDVTLSSESASTGLFALDVPLRIFGSIHDPSVRPVLGGVKVQPTINLDPKEIPAELLSYIQRSPCFAPGR